MPLRSAPSPGTRQRHILPSATLWRSANFSFLYIYFGPQIFCAALLQYQVLHVIIWYIFVAFCYI
jgi:hypothetical protein